MNSSHPASQILIPLPANHKASIDDHLSELLLAREPLDALDQVLVAVPVPGHELANQGNSPEAPPLIHGVEERVVVRLAELEAGKDAPRLEDAVGLAEGGGNRGEVADAEGDGVQVYRCVGDGDGRGAGGGVEGRAGGEVLCVGLEPGEGGLLRGGEGEGALLADGEHGGVDVGDGDADGGVGVGVVRVVEEAEGDVACAAGYVEDVLRRLGRGGERGEARIQGADEVVSVLGVSGGRG